MTNLVVFGHFLAWNFFRRNNVFVCIQFISTVRDIRKAHKQLYISIFYEILMTKSLDKIEEDLMKGATKLDAWKITTNNSH